MRHTSILSWILCFLYYLAFTCLSHLATSTCRNPIITWCSSFRPPRLSNEERAPTGLLRSIAKLRNFVAPRKYALLPQNYEMFIQKNWYFTRVAEWWAKSIPRLYLTPTISGIRNCVARREYLLCPISRGVNFFRIPPIWHCATLRKPPCFRYYEMYSLPVIFISWYTN